MHDGISRGSAGGVSVDVGTTATWPADKRCGASYEVRSEVVGREALSLLQGPWRELCARVVEDNVYYSPRYAGALLSSVEKNTDLYVAVVWHGADLVAMLPFTIPRPGVPLLQPAGRAWRSEHTFSCTPLLDRNCTREAAAALVDALAAVRPGEWLLPTLNIQGDACRAIIWALEQRGRPWLLLNHFQRASLEGTGTLDEHLKTYVPATRRRSLTRNQRRLGQLGKVDHEVHYSGAGLDRAVAAFLTIEASGWKGRRGTALGCNSDTHRFAIAAFTGHGDQSTCRADVLSLNGKPIAVSLIVFAGSTGFAVKTCYDETYCSYGVGLLLEVEIVNSFLAGRWAHRLDAATAGAHVLDGLWPGRIDVADLVFSLNPRWGEARLLALRSASVLQQRVKSGLARCLNPLRTA
jgi:CelD/BcsL family acetyltransferase involved in cellulose biosynthesis